MKIIAAVTFALGTLGALPALADGKGGDSANFPMPAAEFKQKIEARSEALRSGSEGASRGRAPRRWSLREGREEQEELITRLPA